MKIDYSKTGYEISAEMKAKALAANALLHSGEGKGNDFLGWVKLPSSIDDEQLNIQETTAEELLDTLELPSSELPKDRRDELSTYTFERTVDDVDDEEIKRAGFIYTIRTRIRWGSRQLKEEERPKLDVLTFWRKNQ